MKKYLFDTAFGESIPKCIGFPISILFVTIESQPSPKIDDRTYIVSNGRESAIDTSPSAFKFIMYHLFYLSTIFWSTPLFPFRHKRYYFSSTMINLSFIFVSYSRRLLSLVLTSWRELSHWGHTFNKNNSNIIHYLFSFIHVFFVKLFFTTTSTCIFYYYNFHAFASIKHSGSHSETSTLIVQHPLWLFPIIPSSATEIQEHTTTLCT